MALGEVIRDAALGGLGISLHSTWHVCEDLRAGRLKLVLPDYHLPESGIYAVMPQRRMVLPRVRAFVDFLSQQLGETPPWERYLAAKPSKKMMSPAYAGTSAHAAATSQLRRNDLPSWRYDIVGGHHGL